jgi:hypothetical protein
MEEIKLDLNSPMEKFSLSLLSSGSHTKRMNGRRKESVLKIPFLQCSREISSFFPLSMEQKRKTVGATKIVYIAATQTAISSTFWL